MVKVNPYQTVLLKNLITYNEMTSMLNGIKTLIGYPFEPKMTAEQYDKLFVSAIENLINHNDAADLSNLINTISCRIVDISKKADKKYGICANDLDFFNREIINPLNTIIRELNKSVLDQDHYVPELMEQTLDIKPYQKSTNKSLSKCIII